MIGTCKPWQIPHPHVHVYTCTKDVKRMHDCVSGFAAFDLQRLYQEQ